jgi:hypothetical protein
MGLELGSVPLMGLVAAFLAALSTGFLGSLHCVSMCGATIASAMGNGRNGTGQAHQITLHAPSAEFSASSTNGTFGLATSGLTISGYTTPSTVRSSLAFNAGRILSYMIAGALAAGVAGSLAEHLVFNDLTPLRLLFWSSPPGFTLPVLLNFWHRWSVRAVGFGDTCKVGLHRNSRPTSATGKQGPSRLVPYGAGFRVAWSTERLPRRCRAAALKAAQS